MAEYPKAIEELAKSFSALPGIGRRTAERLAMGCLDWDQIDLDEFSEHVKMLKERVKICRECANLADDELCRICSNPQRDKTLVCVVETPRQIPPIEKSGRYKGVFHVLGGRIAPLDGVDVEDLNVETLYGRIERDDVEEVIIATSPDVEGEATATFLAYELRERFELQVSRIAQGVPLGSDLTFADSATMAMAIESRRKI
jgi:recombination protein RecR